MTIWSAGNSILGVKMAKKEYVRNQIGVGQVVGGLVVQAVFMQRSDATHRSLPFCSFVCRCGTAFNVNHQVVTSVQRGRNTVLECEGCKQAKKDNARGRRKVLRTTRAVPPSEQSDFAISTRLRKAIAGLTDDELAKVKKIMAAHVGACLKQKQAIIPAEVLWTEAISLARIGLSDESWTPENRGQGLQIQSYTQYL